MIGRLLTFSRFGGIVPAQGEQPGFWIGLASGLLQPAAIAPHAIKLFPPAPGALLVEGGHDSLVSGGTNARTRWLPPISMTPTFVPGGRPAARSSSAMAGRSYSRAWGLALK